MVRCNFIFALFVLVGVSSPSVAGDKSPLHKIGLPEGLVKSGTKPEVSSLVCFLEGPAVDAKGNVYFSDIAGNRILKRDPSGKVTVFRADSGRTNGNTFDGKGRLISCEGRELGPGGRRRVVRTDLSTGKVTVLADRYQGKRFNSPNDATVDRQGRVWFTDPLYNPDRSTMEMKDEAVYRIDPNGEVTRVLTQPNIHRPNGIALSPDNKTLYVVDSHPKVGGNRKVWALKIGKDGSLNSQRLLFDFGKGRGGDGMEVDSKGNIWVTAGIWKKRSEGETLDVTTGVYVISPEGKLLGRIPIPEDLITNIAFGGPDNKTAYVTSGKTLYEFPINVAGYAINLER